MTAPATSGRRRGGVWRQRDFRVFWTGETTSELGTAVTFVVLPLVAVSQLHAGSFVVAVVTASIWLPWSILGLPAGAWVDRLSRRRLMLVCDAVSALAFASVPIAAWLGVLGVGQLIAVALVGGTASVFFSTAYQVYLPALVEREDLTEANAKLSGSAEAAKVGGPGLGGLLAQAAGAATGLAADAVSFAVSFACLASIRRDDRPAAGGDRSGPHLADEVRQGLRFTLGDPFLRPGLLASATGNLFLTGMDALVVVFLVRSDATSSAVVGVVLAAGSSGGVLGALLARRLARRLGTARTVVVSTLGGLPGALLLPLAAPGAGVALVAAGIFLAAAGVTASNIIWSSFRQTYVPPAMLGRVSACTRTASFSTMPAGALVAGGLGQALGVRMAMWIVCGGIAGSGIVYLFSALRTVRDLPAGPPPTGPDAKPLGARDASARPSFRANARSTPREVAGMPTTRPGRR